MRNTKTALKKDAMKNISGGGDAGDDLRKLTFGPPPPAGRGRFNGPPPPAMWPGGDFGIYRPGKR